MACKIRHDPDADALTVHLKEKGRSPAPKRSATSPSTSTGRRPLPIEVLNASRVVPMMVEATARGEVTGSWMGEEGRRKADAMNPKSTLVESGITIVIFALALQKP
jgi:hypothetical protein